MMTSTTSPLSITAVPLAPTPLPQLSSNRTVGGEVYPVPGSMILTPRISPIAFTTTSPVAPLPPPPQNTTLGGPHSNSPPPTPPRHPSAASNALLRSMSKFVFARFDGISPRAIKLSPNALALLNILSKSKSDMVLEDASRGPSRKFHSFVTGHSWSTSQVKKSRIESTKPRTLSIRLTADPSKFCSGPNI